MMHRDQARLCRSERPQHHGLPLQDDLPVFGDAEIEDRLGRGQETLAPVAQRLGWTELDLQLADVGDGRVGALERPISQGITAAAEGRRARPPWRTGALENDFV